ncbi:MAG: hypothetical protein HUU34_03120 [Saprospiraceae bacterium]|jgi:hypothetical protein|nr:hypothetical protein [Saprospiraceae bacterium]
MINFNSRYLITDQPITCPKCGNRTSFNNFIIPLTYEKVEIHFCLSESCKLIFVVEPNEELPIDDKAITANQ